jgi:hypothetical protein
MKLFLPLLLFGLLGSCKSTPPAAPLETIEWFVGRGAMTVTKSFETTAFGKVLLALDDSSLCKSSGIKYRVEAGGQVLAEETVVDFPVNRDWVVAAGTAVTVNTTVVDVDSTIQCIQLGDVRVTVKF